MSVNKVLLLGNLGRDPELKETATGMNVCHFSIATTEKKGGVKQTEWHNIVVWDKQAQNCAKYLTKGSKVFVEGKIQTRKWEGKDGITKYKTEIIAQNVQFESEKKVDESNEIENSETETHNGIIFRNLPTPQDAAQAKANLYDVGSIDLDDCPF